MSPTICLVKVIVHHLLVLRLSAVSIVKVIIVQQFFVLSLSAVSTVKVIVLPLFVLSSSVVNIVKVISHQLFILYSSVNEEAVKIAEQFGFQLVQTFLRVTFSSDRSHPVMKPSVFAVTQIDTCGF